MAVTPAIIARSKPSDCYHCLIAEALTEATGRCWHVWRKDARCEDDVPGRKIWKFPDFVRRAMNTFDAGQPVEPFTFRIPSRFGGGGLMKRRTKSRAQRHNAPSSAMPPKGDSK